MKNEWLFLPKIIFREKFEVCIEILQESDGQDFLSKLQNELKFHLTFLVHLKGSIEVDFV